MASVPLEFLFGSRGLQLNEQQDFIACIHSGIRTRDGLFKALRCELRLPSYFGCNWDALSDCLRDLSWINQHRVVLVHAELPQLSEDELSMYLDVLAECVDDWGSSDDIDHQFVVVFPEAASSAVSAIFEQRQLDEKKG